jgi:hypothetical protein
VYVLKECRVGYVEMVYQPFKIDFNNIKNDDIAQWT